jgi:hypothetical protein
LIDRHGPIEAFPADVLGEKQDMALLFKKLATLRTDAPLFADAEELRWRGPTSAFAGTAAAIQDPRLLARSRAAADKSAPAATQAEADARSSVNKVISGGTLKRT